ncbi:MAG: tetratricopeptide repeat protein [Gammaproteobacteria bacterium]
MSKPATFRVFVSSVSKELESYRLEVARVLRRRGIEVCDEKHFRQGGATLLETLNAYIENCDAVICLIGHQCGSLPTDQHSLIMGDGEPVTQFRQAAGNCSVSYTQWEYIYAKTLGKATYVFLTDDDFVADQDAQEAASSKTLQASFRQWVKDSGSHRESLNTPAKLVEDVLVLPFPDLTQGKPNNLPQPSLGEMFKGRERFLEALHEQLGGTADFAAVITDKAKPKQAKAVHGSGGIGKTRTAIEYAWRYEPNYSALLFLSGESPELLENSLAGLSDVLAISGLDAAADDKRIAAVINWLQTNRGWLLIVDNVDTDAAAGAIKAKLPQLAHGDVLITSRLSGWSASVKTLDLGVLALADATSYLLDATRANRNRTVDDRALAEQVALKTGRLALGLEHAAAWINAAYLGFSDYLSQWEQDEAGILEEFDRTQIEYANELLVTWKLSVDQLNDEAHRMLEVLSWLSPELIPDAFFDAMPDSTSIKPRRAMANLAKYSLASRVQQDVLRGFQVHRLVQATTRYHQRQSRNNDLPALEQALEWMTAEFNFDPGDVENWLKLEPLAEHAEAVCSHSSQSPKTGTTNLISNLLTQLGNLYFTKARYVAAEPLMRRALAIDAQSFGVEHPRVAAQMNNLASLLEATNRLSEAEPLMRRALAIDEQSFGAEHPNVAIRLNNLAQLLQATNRLSEAEPLMRRTVGILHGFGMAIGHVHPHFESAANNYVHILKASGLSHEDALSQLQKMLS